MQSEKQKRTSEEFKQEHQNVELQEPVNRPLNFNEQKSPDGEGVRAANQRQDPEVRAQIIEEEVPIALAEHPAEEAKV